MDARADCLKLYTQADDRRRPGQPGPGVHRLARRRPDRHAHQQPQANLGDEMLGQLFAKPKALVVAAVFLVLLAFTRLPKIPLLILGGVLRRAGVRPDSRPASGAACDGGAEREKPRKKEPEKVEKLLDVDAMELEVGYGLVRLVDAAKGGDLLDRISMIRRQIAIELGIIVPPIRIRDNMQLGANDYVVKIKGQTVGRGRDVSRAVPGDGQRRDQRPDRRRRRRPPSRPSACRRTGSPNRSAPQAELLNYTVVEADRGAGDAPDRMIKSHAARAADAAGSQEPARQPQEHACRRWSRKSIPTQIKPGELQKVLQNLLRERVPVRDLETILETLGDYVVAHEGPGRADRIRPQRAGADDLQAVRRRSRSPVVRHARSGAGRPDQRPRRAQRARRDVNTMPPQTAQQIVQASRRARRSN